MVYIVPPSSALLENCPQFESLNKKLTLSLLDQDGALKAERLSNLATESELCRVQQSSMKESLLRESIQSLVLSDKLPLEVRHLLAQSCVLPALETNSTSGAVSPFERRNLVAAEIMDRHKYTHHTESSLSPAIRNALRSDISARVKDVGAMNNVVDSTMSNECLDRAHRINLFETDLVERQFVIVSTATKLLEAGNDVVKLLGALLEHNRHGHAERFLRLFGNYLLVVSNGLRSKLDVTVDSAHSALYSSESINILKRLSHENQLIQTNLHNRSLSLEGSLLRYKQGGPAIENVVQEYLRAHLAMLQCEQEIEELRAVKAQRGL